MKKLGIILNESGDLDVQPQRDGLGLLVQGLTLGDVTTQNQSHLLQLHPGELKNAPAVGVGISDMVNDADGLSWQHRIRTALEADGMEVRPVVVTTEKLVIDANYTG